MSSALLPWVNNAAADTAACFKTLSVPVADLTQQLSIKLYQATRAEATFVDTATVF